MVCTTERENHLNIHGTRFPNTLTFTQAPKTHERYTVPGAIYVNNGTPFCPSASFLPFHHKIIDIYDIYEDGI